MPETDVRPMIDADVPSVRRISTRNRPSVNERYSTLWKAGKFTGMYVVTVNRRVAGFGCVSYPRPAQAWLEGLMVDKRKRGLGLGTVLAERLLSQAAQDGARVVRLSTAVANAPMLHIFIDKVGFRPTGRWLRVFGLPPTAFADWPYHPPGKTSPAEAWQFVAASPSYQSSPLLWTTPDDFTVQGQLTEPEMRKLINAKKYIAIRRDGALRGLILIGPVRQQNAPPDSVRLLHISAASDLDFRAGLARAARLAGKRGQTLAFMIPVPSDAVRRQLIRRAKANRACWTELVILEKWLRQ